MREKDRRAYIRLAAYHLVKYKKLAGTGEQAVLVLATIRDIGAGGVCLRTQEYIPTTSLLELKIQFPGFDTPVFTLAKVVWARQIKKTAYYEIGAQFVEIQESVRKVINEQVKLVHDRMKRRKGGILSFLSRKRGKNE